MGSQLGRGTERSRAVVPIRLVRGAGADWLGGVQRAHPLGALNHALG